MEQSGKKGFFCLRSAIVCEIGFVLAQLTVAREMMKIVKQRSARAKGDKSLKLGRVG
jgi:hypothetical protein